MQNLANRRIRRLDLWVGGSLVVLSVLLYFALDEWAARLENPGGRSRTVDVLRQSTHRQAPGYFSGSAIHGSPWPVERSSQQVEHDLRDVFTGRMLAPEIDAPAFRLDGARRDADCASTVWGEGLSEVMGSTGCSEIFRGLYSDDERHARGMIIVLNLRDSQAVTGLLRTLESSRSSTFFYALQPGDVGGHMVPESNWVTAEGRGHYLFIHWVWRNPGAPGGNDLSGIPADLSKASSALTLAGLTLHSSLG